MEHVFFIDFSFIKSLARYFCNLNLKPSKNCFFLFTKYTLAIFKTKCLKKLKTKCQKNADYCGFV